jgi:hypothetical protein
MGANGTMTFKELFLALIFFVWSRQSPNLDERSYHFLVFSKYEILMPSWMKLPLCSIGLNTIVTMYLVPWMQYSWTAWWMHSCQNKFFYASLKFLYKLLHSFHLVFSPTNLSIVEKSNVSSNLFPKAFWILSCSVAELAPRY